MAEEYILNLTGDEVSALLELLQNSGVTQTQLGYLDGLTSNIQNQINAQASAINSHSQSASRVTAGTFAGKVVGQTSAVSSLGDKQFRNITISTTEPTSSDGVNGDIWIVYTE